MAETSQLCPCGSEENLARCCLPVIQGKSKAQTAESLMRARYTAFTRGEVDFILNTHHSRTRHEVNREGIEEWSKNSKWLGLRIIDSEGGSKDDQTGVVTFQAQYEIEGKLNDHRERSLFEREKGEWMFLDAQAMKLGPVVRTEPKVGRNDPCHCGSGKKLKKCHGT